MRNVFFVISCILLFSCQPQKQNEENTVIDLSGTWDLVSYIDFEQDSNAWTQYPKTILYQKHLTETHFTWISYDKESDKLLGMGGGSYEYDGDRYVENIAFFYPPGSSELGQTIPFTLEFKDEKWHHTGYFRNRDIDIETGEKYLSDSSKIKEIWVKTSESKADDQSLAGTWDLKLYKDESDGTYFEYPEMIGYIKLITDTHFVWVKYDKEGDQVYGAGSGPYRHDGENYIEVIEMMYPQKNTLVGTVVDFTLELNDYKWKHMGYPPIPNSNPPDSVFIDEIWTPFLHDMDDEIVFSL